MSMRLPNPASIEAALDKRLVLRADADHAGAPRCETVCGRVIDIGPTLVRASLPGAALSELCRLEPAGIEAEIVGIEGDYVQLSPFAEPFGVTAG